VIRPDDDHFHDECGVFGIFPHPEAARLTFLGLYGLQHRGQEAAGIAVCKADGEIQLVKGEGYVNEVFGEASLAAMPGKAAIGHVRYSTAGDSALINAQPVYARSAKGPVALAHNGNLTNAGRLRGELEAGGSIFQTTSDSEVILHLMARAIAEDPVEALIEALKQVEGAYSLVLLLPDKIVAVRDPRGFRPLVLGKLDKCYVVASETCAFDLIDAQLVREIEPGELVEISAAGMASHTPFAVKPHSPCIFEHIYFARPDSQVFGRYVGDSREALGRALAREQPAPADIVVPVPDSGIGAALGYSHESGIPFAFGLIRNHYVGRTFIQPQQSIRDLSVKVKLNPVKPIIEGKRVVLLDDSIVRGTTSRKIVRMVRAAGAREVHLRISSPPTTGPCHYGIDTPQKSELIAAQHSVEEIRRFVEADSLGYLSIGALEGAIALGNPYCRACFDGSYPVAVDGDERQGMLFAKAR
jgi:amidophosphoribosyltransferase